MLMMALKVGRLDVDALWRELPASALREWQEYCTLDPQGEARGDIRIAALQAQIYNMMRGRGRPLKVADFVPEYGPRKRQDPAAMFAVVKLAADAAAGTH